MNFLFEEDDKPCCLLGKQDNFFIDEAFNTNK